MTDTALVEIAPNPAPGPGARFGRSAGQVGGVVVFTELWVAFGWWHADRWTAEQARAAQAAAIVVAAAVHNAWNWWRTERTRPVQSVEVTAIPAPDHA